MRAALKKMISTDEVDVRASSFSRVGGIEEREERSICRVETLTFWDAACTNGASSFWRRVVLRESRIMWFIPLEAKAAATC